MNKQIHSFKNSIIFWSLFSMPILASCDSQFNTRTSFSSSRGGNAEVNSTTTSPSTSIPASVSTSTPISPLDPGDPNTPPEKINLPGFPPADSTPSDTVATNANSSPAIDGSPTAVDGETRSPPRFAMMARDLECAACHLKVNGDVATIGSVGNWDPGHVHVPILKTDREIILGKWLVSGTFSKKTFDGKLDYPITVRDGILENYTGKGMPKSFPEFDITELRASVVGSVTASNLPAPIKVFSATPIVLIGTKENPIVLAGDIVVDADVVIKGWYKGVGTIYSSGNIYIPANLRALTSAFPFPADPAAARIKARQLLHESNIDGLGLAAQGSIFIGDVQSPIYPTEEEAKNNPDPNFFKSLVGKFRKDIKVDDIFNWFPGGKAGLDALYESTPNCHDPKLPTAKSFGIVEAFLYARREIGGVSRNHSYAINGGVITDVLHIVGRAAWADDPCPSAISTVHGLSLENNYINYDYRMQVGLPIMSAFSKYFTK